MSSLVKDNSIILLNNNSNGNIIINKLMNSLNNTKNENTVKKNHIPLSLNNVNKFNIKKIQQNKKIENGQ